MHYLLLFFLISCSTVSKNKMKADITKRLFDLWDQTTSEISDSKIASIADNKKALSSPFDVAIYFKHPDKKQDWRWSPNDKSQLMGAFEKRKSVGKVFELINTGNDEDIKALRMMAAQQGADALFVVQGAVEVNTDVNGMALTYIALVPMLFANGNTVNSAFVTQGVLWDVRTSQVHLGLQSEGDWVMKRPLAFRQKDRAIEKAKDESLLELEKQILSRKI